MADLENQLTDDYTGRRIYEWGDEQFWSVTTLLQGGVPKYGMVEWAAKATAAAAVKLLVAGELQALYDQRGEEYLLRRLRAAKDEEREGAADIGKYVHRVVDHWHRGQPDPHVPAEAAASVRRLRRWLERARPLVVATEVQVYNRRGRYAGTIDLIAWIQNEEGVWELWLIDVKTGRRIYPEYVLQLAMYGDAEFIGDPDGETEHPVPWPPTGPPSDPHVDQPTSWSSHLRYGLLHIRPTMDKLKPALVDDDVRAAYQAAAGVFTWTSGTSKGRVGDPMAYPDYGASPWQPTSSRPTSVPTSTSDRSTSSSATPGGPASIPPSMPRASASTRSRRSSSAGSRPARTYTRDAKGRFASRSGGRAVA